MKNTAQISMREVAVGMTEPAVQPEKQKPGAQRRLNQAQEEVIRSYLHYNREAGDSALPLREFIQDLEQKLIAFSLLMHMGNQKKVASLLGIKPSTLCEKLHRARFDNLVLGFNNTGDRSAEFLIDFPCGGRQ